MAIQNVLLVDDEPDILEFFAEEVEDWGFKTWKAGNGEEALEICKTQPIELIISDINMPKMDGIALLEKVNSEIDREIFFICMTGYEGYTEEFLRKKGALGLIKKPFDPDQIRAFLGKFFPEFLSAG